MDDRGFSWYWFPFQDIPFHEFRLTKFILKILWLQFTVHHAFFWPDKQTQILLFQSFLLLSSTHESLSGRVLGSGCWPRYGFLLECLNFLIRASFSYNWILSIWVFLKIHFLPEISQLQKGLQIRMESW